ncbi:MAG: hypothetical protein JWP94_3261 [Mucilaginibacter sp.]|nr:hypothetical protein [Mucilaginibacter sp.]
MGRPYTMEIKRNLEKTISRLGAYLNKSFFLITEILRSAFSRQRKMKILFSDKPIWEKNIRIGFSTTKHELTFADFTLENINTNDLLVPLTMRDLKFLSERRSSFKNNLIPIPTLDAINICDDKFLFYQTMVNNGFRRYLPKVGTGLLYPYILKKRIAEDGDNCYIISNPGKERELNALIGNPEYFCQEIVAGTSEYATHMLYKNGKLVSSLNIKYVFDDKTPIKGHDKFISKKICKCPHLALFSSMLESIGFEGLCCFNYKEVDHHPFVLEINPRFGGSLSSFFFSFVTRLN